LHVKLCTKRNKPESKRSSRCGKRKKAGSAKRNGESRTKLLCNHVKAGKERVE